VQRGSGFAQRGQIGRLNPLLCPEATPVVPILQLEEDDGRMGLARKVSTVSVPAGLRLSNSDSTKFAASQPLAMNRSGCCTAPPRLQGQNPSVLSRLYAVGKEHTTHEAAAWGSGLRPFSSPKASPGIC
jgi:hypothetical protein